MGMEEAAGIVKVMRIQEETIYALPEKIASPPSGPQSFDEMKVDHVFRSQISDWCFRVADLFKLNRESVSVAMNCLERYLITPTGRQTAQTRKGFQLAILTSLYMTVKCRESTVISLQQFVEMARGTYTEQHFKDMELSMLFCLQWHITPPTALAFVYEFFQLIPSLRSLSKISMDAAFRLSRIQTELATQERCLRNIKPSTIAIAAIANSYQEFDLHDAKHCVMDELLMVAEVDWNSREEVKSAQKTLRFFLILSGSILSSEPSSSGNTSVRLKETKNCTRHYSPRSAVRNDHK